MITRFWSGSFPVPRCTLVLSLGPLWPAWRQCGAAQKPFVGPALGHRSARNGLAESSLGLVALPLHFGHLPGHNRGVSPGVECGLVLGKPLVTVGELPASGELHGLGSLVLLGIRFRGDGVSSGCRIRNESGSAKLASSLALVSRLLRVGRRAPDSSSSLRPMFGQRSKSKRTLVGGPLSSPFTRRW